MPSFVFALSLCHRVRVNAIINCNFHQSHQTAIHPHPWRDVNWGKPGLWIKNGLTNDAPWTFSSRPSFWRHHDHIINDNHGLERVCNNAAAHMPSNNSFHALYLWGERRTTDWQYTFSNVSVQILLQNIGTSQCQRQLTIWFNSFSESAWCVIYKF